MKKKMEAIGNIRVILGLYRDNGKENGTYREHEGYIGYIGIMEKKVETIGNIRVILGLYRENGKENGSYYNGLYRF